MAIVVDQVKFGSYHYKEALSLRRDLLRTPLGLDFTAEDLAAEPNLIHIVALKDGILAGALYLSLGDAQTMQLRQMCVDEVFRHKGVGALLLRHAERVARKREATRLALNARQTAQIFYEKLGFTPEGTVFESVGLPHIKMVKAL